MTTLSLHHQAHIARVRVELAATIARAYEQAAARIRTIGDERMAGRLETMALDERDEEGMWKDEAKKLVDKITQAEGEGT